MDDIARAYLLLALHLDRHMEGFVDAYVGSPALRDEVMAGEPRHLAALVDDARQLVAAIDGGDYDPQRRDFLRCQTDAMAAVAASLAGNRLDYVQEVERYFDITPEQVDEAVFEAAHASLEALLPGGGPLAERLAAWKKQFELAPDRILPAYDVARRETRRRTRALFDLPDGEDVEVQLVQDKPWSGYNWYLGGYRSRIEVNTDLPVRGNAIVRLIAHEAYPGHHSEHSIKEALLYHGQDRAEHAVQLLMAPECVLSEGIADSAQEIIFSDADLAAFLRDELYPAAGLAGVDVEQQLAVEQAAEGLRWVGGNAALLLYRDERPAEEVQRYVERYALRTPREAAQAMRFIQDPLSRSYIFNYATGKALLAPLLAGDDAVENFRRLLSEPLTPSAVRRWK